MIGPYQVDRREDGTALQVVCVVVDVPDGVVIRDGPGVEGSVIPARTTYVVLLGGQVEGEKPGPFGATGGAVPQHGVKFGFGDCEPIRSQATWSKGYWGTWCRPDVVKVVVPYLAMDSSGACEL